MNDQLKTISEWYKNKCDGKWEHNYGFSLNTLDNPGWELRIDGETEKVPIKIEVDEDIDDENGTWIIIKADNQVFEGFCGMNALEEMLNQALIWLNA